MCVCVSVAVCASCFWCFRDFLASLQTGAPIRTSLLRHMALRKCPLPPNANKTNRINRKAITVCNPPSHKDPTATSRSQDRDNTHLTWVTVGGRGGGIAHPLLRLSRIQTAKLPTPVLSLLRPSTIVCKVTRSAILRDPLLMRDADQKCLGNALAPIPTFAPP